MSLDDNIGKLLGRVALKDRAAFDVLYSLTSPKLFGACLRLLQDRSEAEDALQEIYIKIWHKADYYRPSETAAMGWLYAIARNYCLDRLRARKFLTKPIDDAFNLADKAPNPEYNAMNTGDGRRIEVCMSELEPDKAEAIQAAYVEGYSYAELSERYGIPLNTMRTWLRRSLIKLRKCLES